MLADLNRADVRRRRSSQVDDVDLVVRYSLPGVAVLDPIKRISNQREGLIRGDRQINWGPVIVFISGRLAMIFGLDRSLMSMIETVSLPAGWVIVLPELSSK